jgi:hypothetical protein
MEHQCFEFLLRFMLKGHQNSHNKTAATAWRQHNADWGSEIKQQKTITLPEKNKVVEEIDNEAAG